MARYCFYCGRELATGEKCTCRTHQSSTASSSSTTSSSNSTSASSSARGAGQTNKAGTKKIPQEGTSFWSKFRSPKQKKPGQTGFRTGKPVDRVAILAVLQQLSRYLARPVETIRQAVQYANPTRLLTVLLVHAALGGAAIVMASQMGTLDLLLQLTVISSADSPLLSGLFLFFQGVGLTLTLDLLLILITHLALQYVFHSKFAFSRVATSFVPVFFYQSLFLFLALFSMSAVPISSLMMMAAGLAVAAVALYLAIRQLTSFEENRCFVLMTFILIVFTSVLGAILSLAMPVLTVLLDQTLPL